MPRISVVVQIVCWARGVLSDASVLYGGGLFGPLGGSGSWFPTVYGKFFGWNGGSTESGPAGRAYINH